MRMKQSALGANRITSTEYGIDSTDRAFTDEYDRPICLWVTCGLELF